jgi:hypothetical protein
MLAGLYFCEAITIRQGSSGAVARGVSVSGDSRINPPGNQDKRQAGTPGPPGAGISPSAKVTGYTDPRGK